MRQFARLFEELDQTNKTTVKVDALVRFFEGAVSADKVWAIALLSDRRPPRPVTLPKLREWAAEYSGIPRWLFEESSHVVGDLAETIALLIPATAKPNEHTLHYWMKAIQYWKVLEEEDKKAAVIFAWECMGYYEKFVFNKLITGGFRVGVSRNLVINALSRYTGLPENTLAARLMGDWDPYTIDFDELVYSEDGLEDQSRPYPFCLPYPLEQLPEVLGPINDWMIEYKWDGLRGQLIVREGNLFVWSRGEELMTDKFPELHSLTDILPSGTVIDGEILPVSEGKPLPFIKLQNRIGRKTISQQLLREIPVCLVAYDLLEYGGTDIRYLSLRERRAKLEELLNIHKHSAIQLSQVLTDNDWKGIAEKQLMARKVGAEGLMLKRKDSPYHIGRKAGDWWKWKMEPLTVDGILIYATQGQGRRANLYTDYTFAVWQGNQLVPFTKAYSGLSDAEFRQVDAYVRKNTTERFGPTRSVKPELVFELAFEGIQASPRHKSGIALRFPRIKRWKKDKPASEANTLHDLQQLLQLLKD